MSRPIAPTIQQQATADDPPALVPSEGLFHLDVVVTDQSGNPVTGLSAADFKLLDENHPSKIFSLQAFDDDDPTSPISNAISAKRPPPAEVLLLIDTIGLPDRLATYETRQVQIFLRQNGGHLSQPVRLFGLSNQGLWALGGPSGDGAALAAELENSKKQFIVRRTLATPANDTRSNKIEIVLPFEDPPGLTALKALGQLANLERPKLGRKLLLWVGPGWDVGSGHFYFSSLDREQLYNEISWFSTLLREARIVLYSFSVGEQRPDPKALQYVDSLAGVRSQAQASIDNLDRRVLAVQSGGRVLDPADDLTSSILYTSLTVRTPVFDLVAQINSCIREAVPFYTLSFNPATTQFADEYHDLKIEVDKPGLTAHSSTGYYDQPFFYDWPRPTVRRITVAQLENQLASDRGKRDAELARDLTDVALTEPLSDTGLSALEAGVHGDKSKAVLLALADASQFLDPPAPTQAGDPPPDTAEQARIISLAADYLSETFPKLPNLFATRTTIRYQEIPEHYDEAGRRRIAYQPLQRVDASKATVLYRNGTEVVDPSSAKPGAAKGKPHPEQATGLVDRGSFGPILGAVTDAIAKPGSMIWNRWEHEAGQTRAVFRYVIREPESRFQITYCCLPSGYGGPAYRMLAGHHGEIAIDPASGAILRLVVEADLKPNLPMIQASTLVNYGPVDIGGKTYICPLKSIALTRYRTAKIYSGLPGTFSTFGPYASSLNDVTFSDYHAFRSQARILPDDDPAVQK